MSDRGGSPPHEPGSPKELDIDPSGPIELPHAELRLLGRWRDPGQPWWPNPHDFVTSSWDPDQRARVLDHLRSSPVSHHDESMTTWCRFFCGERIDTSVHQDGVYLWSEGMAHYVEAHYVRPPDDFVNHVLRTPPSSAASGAAPSPVEIDLNVSWWAVQQPPVAPKLERRAPLLRSCPKCEAPARAMINELEHEAGLAYNYELSCSTCGARSERGGEAPLPPDVRSALLEHEGRRRLQIDRAQIDIAAQRTIREHIQYIQPQLSGWLRGSSTMEFEGTPAEMGLLAKRLLVVGLEVELERVWELRAIETEEVPPRVLEAADLALGAYQVELGVPLALSCVDRVPGLGWLFHWVDLGDEPIMGIAPLLLDLHGRIARARYPLEGFLAKITKTWEADDAAAAAAVATPDV